MTVVILYYINRTAFDRDTLALMRRGIKYNVLYDGVKSPYKEAIVFTKKKYYTLMHEFRLNLNFDEYRIITI